MTPQAIGSAGVTSCRASYLVTSGLRLLSTVLFLWALLALYNRQSIAAGTFGLWGFVVAFFGTALAAGCVWVEAAKPPKQVGEKPSHIVFALPVLARVAPRVFTGPLAEASSLLIGRSLAADLGQAGAHSPVDRCGYPARCRNATNPLQTRGTPAW
jgi:hypothetical protein